VDFLLLSLGESCPEFVGKFVLLSSSIFHGSDFFGSDSIEACGSKAFGASGGLLKILGDFSESSLVDQGEEDLSSSFSLKDADVLDL
jgi:hypothetical protein